MTDAQQDLPSAPHRDQKGHRAALLIIDMINCFEFPGADAIRPKAVEAARTISRLRTEMEERGWPIIYVNDNFGEWHSERSRLVERAFERENPVLEVLKPKESDFFIIKPQFSGFYATNLPVLLPKLGIRRLILTGMATDICVLFTAADAHMRDYTLWVPSDAVVSDVDERGRWALEIMANSMGASTAAVADLDLDCWLRRFGD